MRKHAGEISQKELLLYYKNEISLIKKEPYDRKYDGPIKETIERMTKALRKRKFYAKLSNKKTKEINLELTLLYLRLKGLKMVTQKFKDYVKQLYKLILENEHLDAEITKLTNSHGVYQGYLK